MSHHLLRRPRLDLVPAGPARVPDDGTHGIRLEHEINTAAVADSIGKFFKVFKFLGQRHLEAPLARALDRDTPVGVVLGHPGLEFIEP